MAINDVSLTSGMRANLLSLQNTVTLLNRTQNRLSTGKKVNSAIDNPTSYFASQSLTSRASQIDSLKDAMGQAVQTITAANKGITAITSLIEQAKGVAQSAQSAAAGSAPVDLSTTGAVAFHAGNVSLDVADMTTFHAGTVGVDVGAMSGLTAGTVTINSTAMESFSAGTVNITVGTLTAHAYGTVDIDYSAMTEHAYATATIDETAMVNSFVMSDKTIDFDNTDGHDINIGGQTFTCDSGGGADFINQAGLITLINNITGYTATALDADTIHITTNGVVDQTGDITGSGVSNETQFAEGVLGDIITIAGHDYMKGATTGDGIYGFADAAELRTALGNEGYTTSGADDAIVADKTTSGAVGISSLVAGAITSTDIEVAGDSINIAGTIKTAGLDFTSAATMATVIEAAHGAFAEAVNGDVVTVSLDVAGNVGTNDINATTGATANAEVAGDSITFGAHILTAGLDFVVDADAAVTATNLAAEIETADGTLTADATGSNITISKDGVTVTAATFTPSSVNLEVGTESAEVAGDSVTIDGTAYTKAKPGAAGFTDATDLRAKLTAAGYTLAGTDDAIVVSKTKTTVDLTDVSGTGTHVTQQDEVVGSTVTIDGTTYMMGRATNGFDDATALKALLTGAGYTNTGAGDEFVTSKAGVTIDLRNVSGSDGVTANAEIAADTVTFGATTLTAGVDFNNAAELVTDLIAGGFATSSASGNVVTASKDGVTVATTDFTTTAGIDVALKDAEVAATTFTIQGATYTVGVDFQVGADAAATATNLATFASTLEGVSSAVTGGAGSTTVTVTFDNQSTELISLQTQYSTILDQISALATDSQYKGKNLLTATDVSVKFEGASLTVSGFDASKTGLGLTQAAEWTAVGGDISADITKLDAALDTLRQKSSEMSGNLSVITVRQDFSTNMINTLTAGSDLLTQADANEEGANMLMLQTRQSLSTSALSMSAQAAQSVLKLFQ